ncbi:hypothetical protein TVAG_413050 [Trichomonas vaginalis G3]|uniref:TRP C-terminal domain-containing protein n=1 Tax=Trichomonas vaginalis (strain ATCC PRA-98 / G3) TaxID=412133 RepID=A2F6I9_TRIV3|nr:hypothetical protein TVAGG3_0002120 [Trichomonas vaginalis G3]EAX99487.1 hypothetical protein TVAG_413050 [Trichomonas vaginalis G3]KAI5538688.1 hypothetical protein TVAGG3_0002120 [Trichomonas vaginalis G3]|eukprot:XP_001312417.1 hypothetical protein [Trichomonas vaginalis G3]
MGFMLFLFGIFGSCKLTRAAKITNKIGFNRIFLLLFTYALNALYIPILDYFIKIVYNTGVTCPEGYYWGVYRGKDTFLKADGHCIPCGYTLKQKYPGIESFLNDFVQPNSNNFTYSLFTKFLSDNPGILNETYDALNYTMDGLNESSNMCPHLCSGSFIRIMKDQTSIYFDFETKRYFMFFICWVIAFVLLVIPVLYYLLIYRARKEFKTLVAYGDNKDDRWECLLERVETVGVTHLKDYNYSNPYFAVFKIVYNFLVLLVTTLANLAHPHIITCLPIVHITMIVFLTLRKPYLSKWNNYSEIALSVLNLIIGILASVNLFSDVNQVFNTVIVLIADFLGVASEIGSAIIESYEKSKITDPTIMNEKEIQEFHPLIFDEDEEQGILEPLINEEEDSEDCLCGCLRERKVPKLMQYEPDNRPEISLKDLNPVESGVQLFNDAQPERSGEIRKRLQNLYIFYDILIDGAELSILTRFLRLLGVFGLAVSTPIINVKSVRFSCINYGSWF